MLSLFLAGCGPQGAKLVLGPETADAQYQYGQQMLRETRPDDALNAFLAVIKERQDDAPESHLEAGRILLNDKHDPVEAIHHFRQYLAAQPNSEQAPMVKQMIETAEKDFVKSLPGNQNTADEIDLVDQVASLKAENENLRHQMGGQSAGFTGLSLQNPAPMPAPPPVSAPTVAHASPAPQTTPPPPSRVSTVSTASARTYTVQSNDTLSSISYKIYGVRSRYLEIYQANTDQLTSPNAKLHIGQVLKLPPQ